MRKTRLRIKTYYEPFAVIPGTRCMLHHVMRVYWLGVLSATDEHESRWTDFIPAMLEIESTTDNVAFSTLVSDLNLKRTKCLNSL